MYTMPFPCYSNARKGLFHATMITLNAGIRIGPHEVWHPFQTLDEMATISFALPFSSPSEIECIDSSRYRSDESNPDTRTENSHHFRTKYL